MNHCPVTADLNRHLNQLDRDEARAEAVDAKLDEMMADRKTLAAIIDDVLQADPYMDIADIGSTNLANDLATVLLEDDASGAHKAMEAFFDTLRDAVRTRMALDAETAVAADEDRAAQDAAEARDAAREDWP